MSVLCFLCPGHHEHVQCAHTNGVEETTVWAYHALNCPYFLTTKACILDQVKSMWDLW
jgi:hypothetical protein